MTRSLVIERPGSFRIAEGETPEPGPGEAVVRIAAAGICGSDRELLAGDRPEPFRSYPIVPGHEWSGVVASIGPGVDPALTGRPVVGEGFRNCQVCDRCREGDTNLCTAGYDETGFTRPGGFAEHLVIPARLLHGLPDGADLRAAALLEPAAVAAAVVMRAAVRPGERVAVVGAGTIGALCTQFLHRSSPAELAVTDPRAGRAETALACGATRFGPLADGAYDVVVETAGAGDAASAAVRAARRGGRIVLAGIPGRPGPALDPGAIVGGHLAVAGVFGASSAAWVHAVRLFSAGLLDLGALITHEFDLAEFGRATALLDGNRDDVGKVILRP